MNYTVENKVKYAVCFMGILLINSGCAVRQIDPAASAVMFWDTQFVCIVADGFLPEEFDGWRLMHSTSDEVREVRVTEVDAVKHMLRRWRDSNDILFFVQPISRESAQSMEPLSWIASEFAREKAAKFVLLFSSADRADSLKSELLKLDLRYAHEFPTFVNEEIHDFLRPIGMSME